MTQYRELGISVEQTEIYLIGYKLSMSTLYSMLFSETVVQYKMCL